MPNLAGFSDNPLRSRADVARAAEALLQPLVPYFSPGNTHITIPWGSGAHFDETAAALEGYARPLWIVGSLLAVQGPDDLTQHWITGLKNGVDPAHQSYWGPIGNSDQRMVEAEILSFALLAAPQMYASLDAVGQTNLTNWLRGLNGKTMPENNWRFFRILSNLALIKVCGVPTDEVWQYMQADLATMESFYMSEGWSSDGLWRPVRQPGDEGSGPETENRRAADYYSGSFAIQFSQLLYARYADDIDPERCALFRRRAREFAKTFSAYFDSDGASIPFGRSLTYRFAMGGFYAAFAVSGLCDDSDPAISHGTIKGMLLRHLRWWATHSENVFATDGTLNIGFLYPNMYMSESYNSPQSPYWATKSFISLALAEDSPYWTAKEAPHASADIVPVRPARQIVCNHSKAKHHFLLSSGQFATSSMVKAAQAKYSKFAYSSAFAFSVPTGPALTQTAADSVLALSCDEGESWAVRGISIGETQFVKIPVGNAEAEGLVSVWKPWASKSVQIETTLVAPCDSWPDWHVRVHRIDSAGLDIDAVEAGFSIDGRRKSDGRAIPTTRGEVEDEVALEKPDSALIVSSAGASGVVDLIGSGKGEVQKPDPNTNLVEQRTLLPTVKYQVKGEVLLVLAVFGMSYRKGALTKEEVKARWEQRPKVTINGGKWSLE